MGTVLNAIAKAARTSGAPDAPQVERSGFAMLPIMLSSRRAPDGLEGWKIVQGNNTLCHGASGKGGNVPASSESQARSD